MFSLDDIGLLVLRNGLIINSASLLIYVLVWALIKRHKIRMSKSQNGLFGTWLLWRSSQLYWHWQLHFCWIKGLTGWSQVFCGRLLNLIWSELHIGLALRSVGKTPGAVNPVEGGKIRDSGGSTRSLFHSLRKVNQKFGMLIVCQLICWQLSFSISNLKRQIDR